MVVLPLISERVKNLVPGVSSIKRYLLHLPKLPPMTTATAIQMLKSLKMIMPRVFRLSQVSCTPRVSWSTTRPHQTAWSNNHSTSRRCNHKSRLASTILTSTTLTASVRPPGPARRRSSSTRRSASNSTRKSRR